MSLDTLYLEVRARFAAVSDMADRRHLKQWGEFLPEGPYAWFESLANALNDEMCREVPPAVHLPLLRYLEGSLGRGDDVYRCIDVAFVENLFWQVGARRATPYWVSMPPRLQALYLGFHSRPPVE